MNYRVRNSVEKYSPTSLSNQVWAMNRDRETLGTGSSFSYSCSAHTYIFYFSLTLTHTHIPTLFLGVRSNPGSVFPQPPSVSVVTHTGLQSRRTLLIHGVLVEVSVCVFISIYGPGLLHMLVPTQTVGQSRGPGPDTSGHTSHIHTDARISIFSTFCLRKMILLAQTSAVVILHGHILVNQNTHPHTEGGPRPQYSCPQEAK